MKRFKQQPRTSRRKAGNGRARKGTDDREPRRIWQHPKTGGFLASAIASAIIGSLLSPNTFFVVKNSVLGGDSNAPAAKINALPSQILSATRIGLFNIEENSTLAAAQNAFGEPTSQRIDQGSCLLEWKTSGVAAEFYTLGLGDPCIVGDFCRADVSGRQWVTRRGLQVGETTSRMLQLYPSARDTQRPGALGYWVLEAGANSCGQDSLGGLVARTFNGRVNAFEVSFHAGGD